MALQRGAALVGLVVDQVGVQTALMVLNGIVILVIGVAWLAIKTMATLLDELPPEI